MSTGANFVQLLESVKDKFSLTDRELARELDCEPTYISRIRGGKANAGPWITKALVRLNECGPDHSKPDETTNETALKQLATLAGVAETELLARMISKHGLETALELKKEREKLTDPVPQAAENLLKTAASTVKEK